MMDNVLDNLNFSDNLILVANSVDNTMTHTTLITNRTDFPGSNLVRAAKLIYNMRMNFKKIMLWCRTNKKYALDITISPEMLA